MSVPSRLIVTGTSGSGKTTFARAIAARLGIPHAEQDAWNHLPNWQEAPLEQFRAAVDAFSAQPTWVMDGNYTKAQDIGWARADTLIWLDYSAPLVFWRLLRRTLRRGLTREELWNGNRESLPEALFSRGGIMAWFFRTYWRRKREMPEKLAQYPHLRVLRFRRPAEAARWFAGLERQS
ncbi:adenylate kinase [Deinococcus sp. KNUC1210]|uniref:AAA family ATPase n=1 Tax=Deinococcus sp. KNUC1210 TaxID=2917691 RepID=UPI001EF124B8|nr:AAA family ATPase [Deinococcus sp. KNUC1210]ULH16353.1 adenylate kinase [Deinococcus sp. KNUC1210]